MSPNEAAMLAIVLGEKKPKPPERHEIRFDVPKLTPQQIVDSVQHDKAVWKTLEQTAVEDAAMKRARKLSDRYDLTPIPRPEWDDNEEWHL